MDLVTGKPQFAKRKGPGKGGRALQARNPLKAEFNARQALVGELEVPEGTDPVEKAEAHIKSLAPIFAKEIEYAAKFGSDAMRYQAAKDGLAMAGITTKNKDAYQPPVSMTFNVNGLPTTPKGTPILPFSNAGKKLLDAKNAVVTVTSSDATKKDT